MKFLIHANAPWVSTGYGVQCAYLAERLKAEGHDVAISSTYGQQGQMATWHGIPIYPCGYEVNSNDILHVHAMHWFEGDPNNGWIITLLDVWCLQNPRLAEFNILAWCPVDHYPVPPGVRRFFQMSSAVPVAMSRYGEAQLAQAGLAPFYVPLTVDTSKYKPTRFVEIPGRGQVTGRELLGIPEDAFVVGMVAMNKGWSVDRKGFNEAFRAFGMFWQKHNNAVLYVHADWPGGAEGMNLKDLAMRCAIPEHALVFVDQYAYRMGFPPEMMAATYSAMDVLLAPSHGEGFCVPMIEAQACGTPVIATDFSAQKELVGSGWRVMFQAENDPAQSADLACPYVFDILNALEDCYRSDLNNMAVDAIEFAGHYDTDKVFYDHWLPLLDRLEESTEPLQLERSPIPTDRDAIAVIVPVMKRPQNVWPLVQSMLKDYEANIYFVCDDDDEPEIKAVETAAHEHPNVRLLISDRGRSFAQKVNSGYKQTTEPWLFVCGDDVAFTPGWIEAARRLSDRFDVIGTNDTDGAPKNPDVAAGRHADHFFLRRSYIDEYGAALDGPGVAAPEAYKHFWVDREMVGLAKARGVFTPCMESRVLHLHPAFDGREDLRQADPVYMLAQEHAVEDNKTFIARAPLIEMQRTSYAKVR